MTNQPHRETPLKVLHVVGALGMGGAETWLMEALRLWSADPARPVQLDFLLTNGRPDLFDAEARQLGAKLFYVPFQKQRLPAFAREFRRILRVGRYDAIHDHADLASGWHYLCGLGCLPPVRITHVHTAARFLNFHSGNIWRRLGARCCRRLVAHNATLILGTSRQLLEENGYCAPPFLRPPKAVVHCGFSLKDFAGSPAAAAAVVAAEFGWPPGTPVVLFAGRLDAALEIGHPENQKNSAFAVEVFRHCRKQSPDLKFIMAGVNAHVRDAFAAHLAGLGLSECVRLLGVRRDMGRLMLGARALLFPSRAEGLGMVAVEAQAAGLPVLASAAVPHECVVIPEHIRFLDLRNPVAEWAAALNALLTGPRPQPTVEDPRWARSAFNILVSTRQLRQVYATGKPPAPIWDHQSNVCHE